MAQGLDYCALILWSVVRTHLQLDFHLEWGKSPALCYSRRMNHDAWSNGEERHGHCLISKNVLSVQISAFDI